MAVSHWDRLPDKIEGLIYQFDSTAKSKFNEVINELEEKINKARTIKTYHRYSLSKDIDYTFTHFQIPTRRKSRVSKYNIKRNHFVLLAF